MNNRENLISSIKKLGWNLTNEAVDELIIENNNLKQNDLIKIALDTDLKNIGAKFLPDLATSAKTDSLEGPCVLQLIKIRNIAAPKENETSGAAPPLFRLTLTDGTISLNALVIDHDNNKQLNLNIPPGTKILIKNTVKIKSNLLILNNQTYQILGGNVQYLVEKWKTNRELQQHVRVVSAMATAPPWVPFGVRQINQVDTSKKVFAQNEKQEEDSTSDFSQARQAALAEAMEAKLKITKTFTQQTIDKSQIISNESTPEPVKTFTSSAPTSSSTRGKGGRGRKGKNLDRDDENDYKESKDAAKPSSVTLFDMVKNHLDIKEQPETSVAETTHQKTNNDYDESRGNGFRGGRGGGRGRGRGGGRFQQKENRFNSRNQNENNNNNKQVYDKDDFSFALGDTTKVKDLVKIPNKVEEEELAAASAIKKQIPSSNNKFLPKVEPTITQNDPVAQTKPYNQQQQQQQQQPRNKGYQNNQSTNYNNNFNNNYNYQNEPPPPRQKTNFNQINWRSGDECLARNPQDNRLYPAVIQNINFNNGLCIVNFIGYNQYYEVYLDELAVLNTNNNNNFNNNYNNNNNNNYNQGNNNRQFQNRRY